MNTQRERDQRASYRGVSPHAGLTRCLMCGRFFRSVDVRRNRRCKACADIVERLGDRLEDGWLW